MELGRDRAGVALRDPRVRPGSRNVVRSLSGDKNYDAGIVYASDQLVAGILPADIPIGDATFTVASTAGRSAASRMRVLPRAFAVFTQDGRGSGPAEGNPFDFHFIEPGAGVTFEWEGGDPNKEIVVISAQNDDGIIAEPDYFGFTCVESVAKGSFTVPSRVLDPMRSSGSKSVFLGITLTGLPQPFSARGLDLGWSIYESTDYLGYRIR